MLPLSFQTWDDRGSWFKAPTMRGLTDMAVTIGATALLPGAGSLLANAALNLADDAVFAVLDVGGGYKSWEEAGLEFGKKALSSAVNIGVGQLYSPVMTAVSASPGVGGVIGSTVVGGMQTVTTSTLNSAVNAITWDKEHGFGWSADAFNAGVQGGLISAATGMTSSLTSGVLGVINLYGRNSGALNPLLYNTKGISDLNSLIGGIAGQAVNYSLSGDMGFNLINLSMFGIPGADEKTPLSMGLFEVNIGKNGITTKIGSGGVDISIGKVASALSGMRDAISVMKAKAAALFGNMGSISTIDSSNMMSYNGGRDFELARSIKNGKMKVQYGKIDGGGMYNVNTDVITITEELLGGDRQTSAMLAAMLSHEGTHAEGDRVEVNAHMNAKNTYEKVCANYNIQKDTIFSAMMEAGIADPANTVANTGDVDWWKLVFKNGRVKLEWDKTNTITLPDGTKINANLAKGETDSDFSLNILSRTLFGRVNTRFIEDARSQLYAQGYMLGEDGEWEKRYLSNGVMHTIQARNNIDLSLDITSQFDSSWQSMGGTVLYDWVYRGAVGVANVEVGSRSSSFFAIARMGAVAKEMQNDVVYVPGTNTIDWAATLLNFDEKRDLYSTEMVIGKERLYDARLAKLKAGAYGLIADLSSPGGPGKLLSITQYQGKNGTVEYSWRVEANGKTYHPGIDYKMDGDPVYAGVYGKILKDPVRTTSTYYANEDEFKAAKDLAKPDCWESNRWHEKKLRMDDKTSAVIVDIGFQFESFWVSSGMNVSYLHLGDIPSTLVKGTLVTPATHLGSAGDYGYATGPHLDQTYWRPASSRPSLFEIVFRDTVYTPWNNDTNAWNINAYYKPDWMRLFITDYKKEQW